MDKELQKKYITYYNSSTAQNLWEAHYQILSIFFQNSLFIESNVNMDMMIKCETCGIKI